MLSGSLGATPHTDAAAARQWLPTAGCQELGLCSQPKWELKPAAPREGHGGQVEAVVAGTASPAHAAAGTAVPTPRIRHSSTGATKLKKLLCSPSLSKQACYYN